MVFINVGLIFIFTYKLIRDHLLEEESGLLIYLLKGLRLASIAFLVIGGFFMFHTLYPMSKDFPEIAYYSIALVSGVVLCFALLRINSYIMLGKERLKLDIRNLIDFIVINRRKVDEDEMWEVLKKVSK